MSLEIKSVDYMLNLPLKSRAVIIRERIKLYGIVMLNTETKTKNCLVMPNLTSVHAWHV